MTLKVLALDTSTEACSAALSFNDEIISQYQIAPRQHTYLILPMLQSLLDTAGMTFSDLDAIAFGRGPGSFTGVRIAASVVQAMAFAHDLPVVPISTLQALAQSAYRESQTKNIIAAIDARMNEIYWGAYQLSEKNIMLPITAEAICLPAAIKINNENNFVGVGSGWDSYYAIMQNEITVEQWLPQRYPHAYDIAVLAQTDFREGKAVSAEQALPVYLRDKVTHQSV